MKVKYLHEGGILTLLWTNQEGLERPMTIYLGLVSVIGLINKTARPKFVLQNKTYGEQVTDSSHRSIIGRGTLFLSLLDLYLIFILLLFEDPIRILAHSALFEFPSVLIFRIPENCRSANTLFGFDCLD